MLFPVPFTAFAAQDPSAPSDTEDVTRNDCGVPAVHPGPNCLQERIVWVEE